MSTPLTTIPVTQLAANAVDRASTPRALKILRDETEARLLAIELGAADWKDSVHLATAAALPANTRTSNRLLANAVGAIGNIDAVAPVVGRRYLVQNEGGGVSHANNGIFTYESADYLGTGKWSFLRSTDADESSEVTADMVIPIELGTIYGGQIRQLKTTGTVTLNTTA